MNFGLKIINAFNQMTKIILLENCESRHIDKFFDVKKFDNKIVKLLSLGVSTSRPIEIEIENVLSVETSF